MLATITQLEFYKEWIAALKSGRYLQGIGALHTKTALGSEFCCIGVSCEVALKHDMVVRQLVLKHDAYNYAPVTDQRNIVWGVFPRTLQLWLGIHADDQDQLVRMNDHGVSFSEIASWIEINLMTRWEK
jgi:hypothetical protein